MPTVAEMTATIQSTPAEAVSLTMRAIVHPRYGEPDVLEFGEVERPMPGNDDVLVRVHAANASVGDHHVVTGKPYAIRLSPYGGLPRPKNRVPGTAIALTVRRSSGLAVMYRRRSLAGRDQRHRLPS